MSLHVKRLPTAFIFVIRIRHNLESKITKYTVQCFRFCRHALRLKYTFSFETHTEKTFRLSCTALFDKPLSGHCSGWVLCRPWRQMLRSARFSKIEEPHEYCKRQESDIKEVLYWGRTYIRRCHNNIYSPVRRNLNCNLEVRSQKCDNIVCWHFEFKSLSHLRS
jgi:hypothetical protein